MHSVWNSSRLADFSGEYLLKCISVDTMVQRVATDERPFETPSSDESGLGRDTPDDDSEPEAALASESQVALVNSLLAGFYLLAGPFVSALANKYGFRIVTIVGSLISSAAFALSYFAGSVEYLYLVYGVSDSV
ncbi:unnamed protein product [Leptidea sinapis]|uniref:Major facilitator superfamily (MFS) profile domain-containing protein n=1 Tax=Leptidea sinapis TaxID=189913 RepID=A0A5E4Q137_9NEOP|nr:unnamed protein product [Leptidea sinapis]